jgi:hypothetical protein
MKLKVIFIVASLLFVQSSFAQTASWDKWSWLIGKWENEHSGKSEDGNGTFSLFPDLDSNVLIRRSSTHFPAALDRAAFTHNDLLVIYPDYPSKETKAIYFDNEKHTISYAVNYSEKEVVFQSEGTGIPVFRLRYTYVNDATIRVSFDISMDGVNFATHVSGNCVKVE